MRQETDAAGKVPERFVPQEMKGELVEAEHLTRYWWSARRWPRGGGCSTRAAGWPTASPPPADAGASEVTGVDLAEDVIRAARAEAGERFVRLDRRPDVRSLPFADDAFDLVVLLRGDRARRLARQRPRRAAAGAGAGRRAGDPRRTRHAYVPGNPHHVHEFSTGEFRALLGETFPRVRLLVQHQWLASAVMEESDLVGDGTQDIRAGIAAERALGSETYTVALAGTEPLPEPPPLAVFTDTVEARRWMEHFDEQQTILRDQADYLEGLQAIDAQRRDLQRRLVASETELALALEARRRARARGRAARRPDRGPARRPRARGARARAAGGADRLGVALGELAADAAAARRQGPRRLRR